MAAVFGQRVHFAVAVRQRQACGSVSGAAPCGAAAARVGAGPAVERRARRCVGAAGRQRVAVEHHVIDQKARRPGAGHQHQGDDRASNRCHEAAVPPWAVARAPVVVVALPTALALSAANSGRLHEADDAIGRAFMAIDPVEGDGRGSDRFRIVSSRLDHPYRWP